MKALIVVDAQKDFCPGGSLAVKDGEKIIPNINKLMSSGIFDTVIATKDWHPEGHVEFNKWLVHCVQGTKGATFHPALDTSFINMIIYKGTNKNFESYSGFADADGNETGLRILLAGYSEVYIVGIATEVCVLATAMDAVDMLRAKTSVIKDACAGIDEAGSDRAFFSMKNAGINITTTSEVLSKGE